MAILKQIDITDLDTNTTSSNPLGAEAENIDISRDSSGDITDVAHQDTSESLNTTLSNIEDKLEGVQHNFLGTLAEWNALTDAEKAEYDTYDIIDEFNTIPIDDALSSVSTNPVQNKVIKAALDTMNSNFQAGCNTIMQAVTAKGVTPASNSPSDISTAISNISTGADLLDILLGNVTIDIESTLLKMTKSQFNTYKSQLVGKTVSISNSQQDGAKSMDWVIIDYNHDSTSYTFDLWATRAMFDSVKFGSSQRYQDSSCTARTKIEGAISGFSSELQAKLQTMSISVNSTTVSAKIKLLSLTEMGISSGNYHPGTEGNVYDKYFTTGRSTGNTYADLIRNNSSGSATWYWSRSRNTGNSSNVCFVSINGSVDGSNYAGSNALIPAIRIAVG